MSDGAACGRSPTFERNTAYVVFGTEGEICATWTRHSVLRRVFGMRDSSLPSSDRLFLTGGHEGLVVREVRDPELWQSPKPSLALS